MATERNSKFDNLKFFLIFLVVLCHFFELFDGDIRYRIYMIIYTFHMPLFVFVSGYFGRFDLKSILCRQVYPYVIFQVLFCLCFGESVQLMPPYWLLWYMICLAVWNLSLGIVKKHLPMWIGLSFVLALGIGFLNIGQQRLFCFYPFFLLGVWCRQRGFFADSTRKKQLSGVCLIVLSLVITGIILPFIHTNWLFHSQAYSLSEGTALWRGGLMILSLVWCVGFLLAMPKKKIPIVSDGGRYCICIFLIHGLFQRLCLYKVNPFVFSEWLNILMAVFVSLGVCMLLGNRYVFGVIKPVTDLNYLYRKVTAFYERINRKNT